MYALYDHKKKLYKKFKEGKAYPDYWDPEYHKVIWDCPQPPKYFCDYPLGMSEIFMTVSKIVGIISMEIGKTHETISISQEIKRDGSKCSISYKVPDESERQIVLETPAHIHSIQRFIKGILSKPYYEDKIITLEQISDEIRKVDELIKEKQHYSQHLGLEYSDEQPFVRKLVSHEKDPKMEKILIHIGVGKSISPELWKQTAHHIDLRKFIMLAYQYKNEKFDKYPDFVIKSNSPHQYGDYINLDHFLDLNDLAIGICRGFKVTVTHWKQLTLEEREYLVWVVDYFQKLQEYLKVKLSTWQFDSNALDDEIYDNPEFVSATSSETMEKDGYPPLVGFYVSTGHNGGSMVCHQLAGYYVCLGGLIHPIKWYQIKEYVNFYATDGSSVVYMYEREKYIKQLKEEFWRDYSDKRTFKF